jgi:hypothetical protein
MRRRICQEFAMQPLRIAVIAAALLLASPGLVYAGMPSIRLTDMARLRLESVSFFLVGFLVCSGLIQLIWNGLRKDFAVLPRLSYPKALGLVTLWGLLFILVLTMISGARELMTPGAWEKKGLTYRVVNPAQPTAIESTQEMARQQRLYQLRVALWKYASAHDGHFPDSVVAADIKSDLWQLPGPSGLSYLYVAGQIADKGQMPLAYEPELDGIQRFVLLTNGEIRSMDWRELEPILTGGKDR